MAIQDWKRAGKAQADGADVGVRLGSKAGGASAENLGAGGKLNVNFEADHRLIFGDRGVERIILAAMFLNYKEAVYWWMS